MSTRCTINFVEGRTIEAKIYRHMDGYPDGPHGVPADLERFFAAVEEQTNDTRFNQADYLAAKFVVWQARENTHSGMPLDFLSLGILRTDPADIEYTYFVDSADLRPNGRPTVRVKAVKE